jgi:hypothetical protein
MSTATAWAAAWQRLTEGYGDEPDLDDPHDRHAFLQLLESEVKDGIETELARVFAERAARLQARRAARELEEG